MSRVAKLIAGILFGISIALIYILTVFFPSLARGASQGKGAFELMIDGIGTKNIAILIATLGVLRGGGMIVFLIKHYQKEA